MSKDNKNEMTTDPEDQTKDFPRGTPASANLEAMSGQGPANAVPSPSDGHYPTAAGRAAEAQGRTTQESVDQRG